jgi:flagellar biosynthesis protein FlhB
MADRSASDKTEEPTAERLRRAKLEGQVPFSQELPTALVLVALLGATAMTSGSLWQWCTAQAREGLMLHRPPTFDIASVTHLLHEGIVGLLTVLAPFFVLISVASVLGCILVSGLMISPKALEWKFERLLPSAGLQGLFSPKSGAQLVAALIKLVVLGVIAYTYLGNKLGECMALSSLTPLAAATSIFDMIFGLLVRVTVAMAVIAVLDVLYQRWQWRRNLRMTHQEVKEERKSHEGSPHTKNRILSMHFGMLRKRMLKNVPTADVIVVNPTHVAVALKYDAASMQAPMVVAKGADLLCAKIKELARKHRIPVVEKPELARTLYGTVEVGQTIPDTLYVAVAEILATIYRLRHAR